MKQKLKDSFLYAFRRSMPIMIGYLRSARPTAS